jgi:hypothetical protein
MMAIHDMQAPFPADAALNRDVIETSPQAPQQICDRTRIHDPAALNSPGKILNYIPGDPSVSLDPKEVYDFLSRELNTPVLDELYPRLWLAAKKASHNIDPLNVQRFKQREILAVEDPKLHLIWQHNRIFLKPIPVCLLNYEFWSTFLVTPQNATLAWTNARETNLHFDRSVALGFLRSYALLIQHRLDFTLARENHLIPGDFDWIEWSTFMAHFRHIQDDQVSRRYHFGQLRLSRLNWVTRLLRPRSSKLKWYYEVPHWSISAYMESLIAPVLFAFASLSVILSSMQVVLSTPPEGLFQQLNDKGVQAMRRTFWAFSVLVLFFSNIMWGLLIAIPFLVLFWQAIYGFRNRKRSFVVSAAEKA